MEFLQTIAESSVHASAEFERNGLECTLSIRDGELPEEPSKLVWVKDGKTLYEASLSDTIKRLWITIVGEVEPNARFDGPAPSDLNKGIVLDYLAEVPNLFESYAAIPDLFDGSDTGGKREDDEECELLITYLDQLVCGNLLSGFLAASAFDWHYGDVRDLLACESPHFAVTPSPSVNKPPEPLESGGRRVTYRMVENSEISPADLLAVADALGAVGEAPIFEELDGTRLSLQDLAAIFENQGVIYAIHKPDFYLQKVVHVPAYTAVLYLRNKANTGRIIWSNDPIDRILYNLIGPNAQSGSERLFFEERKRIILKKPVLEFELPKRDFLITSSAETDLARIKIGMQPPRSYEDAANVDVRYNDRRVSKYVRQLNAGVFEVVVELTGELLPERSFEHLEAGDPHDPLFEDIEKACTELICTWIKEHTKTFDAPGSLPVDEGHFWRLVERLRTSGELNSIVVAQNEDGDDIQLMELHRYARQKAIAYYRDSSSPIRELLPSQNFEVLKVRKQTPIEELADFEWIDISQTPEHLEAVESNLRKFMAKPVREIEAVGIPESRVAIELATHRGEARVSTNETNSKENQVTIWFHHKSRAVGREIYSSFVPFGNYEAVIDSDSFKLDAEFTKVIGGKDAAVQLARRAAQDSFIALCDAWDASVKLPNQRTLEILNQRTLEILENALVKSLSVKVWPRACERVQATKLFDMADGTLCSYDDLVQIAQTQGTIYWWLFSFWRNYENRDELYSVSPSSVVLVDSPDLVVEDPSRLTIDDASRIQASVTPPIVEALTNLPWKQAPTKLRWTRSGNTIKESSSIPGTPDPYEEESHPIVEALQDHFARISDSDSEGDRLTQFQLQRISLLSLGANAALARARAGVLELNIDHPTLHYYEANEDDTAALAFVAMAVLLAVRSPEVRTPDDARSLIAEYTAGARHIL